MHWRFQGKILAQPNRGGHDARAPSEKRGNSVAGVEHVPVLLRETLAGLALRPGGRYIDGTAGSGGHAVGIWREPRRMVRFSRLILTRKQLMRVQRRLLSFGARARVVQANFRDLEAVATQEGWVNVDGILLDLGVSSVQLGDTRARFQLSR